MTPLATHCQKWKDGCGSNLCSKPRVKVVLGRGSVPCEVLLVGEAPGMSENATGLPFDGPAGIVLDRIVKRSVGERTWAMTNIVGCIPLAEDGSKDIEPPDMDSVLRCRARIEEFIAICRPKLIVAVGKEAKEYLEQGYKFSITVPDGVVVIPIVHPAWILRQQVAQRGYEEKKAVVQIASALRRMEEGKVKLPEPVRTHNYDDEIPF